MAEIDLGDLIEDLRSEVNPPGSDLFPESNDDEWLSMLRNAFWEAVLDGIISGYTEEDGVVSPKTGDSTFPREMQQVVISYAGLRVIRAKMLDMKTLFRSKAGPVEYEVQQSAMLLKQLLVEATRRRDMWLERLGHAADAANGYYGSYYIDGVQARQASIISGHTVWVK